MKKILISILSLITLFGNTTFAYAGYINMGAGGITQVQVFEEYPYMGGNYIVRGNVGTGYCDTAGAPPGYETTFNFESGCSSYFSTIGQSITFETETDVGNPTTQNTFYVNCQDPSANNYDPTWTIDTGECTYDPIPIGEMTIATTTCSGTYIDGIINQNCLTNIDGNISIAYLPLFIIIFLMVVSIVIQLFNFNNPWKKNVQ